MKVELTEKGDLFIDGETKQISDLNASLLENIVKELLNKECEIIINKDNPLGNFLEKLKEETSDDSELYKSISAFKEEKKALLNNLENLDLSYENVDDKDDLRNK